MSVNNATMSRIKRTEGNGWISVGSLTAGFNDETAVVKLSPQIPQCTLVDPVMHAYIPYIIGNYVVGP
jgi:hypothetical protein